MRYMIDPEDRIYRATWKNKESGNGHKGPPLFVKRDVRTEELPQGETVLVPMPEGRVKSLIRYATGNWTRATYGYEELPGRARKKFFSET